MAAAAAAIFLVCLALLSVHGRQTVNNYCYHKTRVSVSESAVKVWNGSRLDCAQLFASSKEGKCHTFVYDNVTGLCLNVTGNMFGKDAIRTTRAEKWDLIPCKDQRPCGHLRRKTYRVPSQSFNRLHLRGGMTRELTIFLSIYNCRGVEFAFLPREAYRYEELFSVTLPQPGNRSIALLNCSVTMTQCRKKNVLSNLTMPVCKELSPFWVRWILGDVFIFKVGYGDTIGKETLAEFKFKDTPPLQCFVIRNNGTAPFRFSSTKRVKEF